MDLKRFLQKVSCMYFYRDVKIVSLKEEGLTENDDLGNFHF